MIGPLYCGSLEALTSLTKGSGMVQNYEEFSESQIKILDRFVSSTTSNVFVLRNLPEVIKGALFSRYSRSSLGLRSLLLKEFILNEDTAFKDIAGKFQDGSDEQIVAIKKASGQMVFNPIPSETLEVGDVIVVIGKKEDLKRMSEIM